MDKRYMVRTGISFDVRSKVLWFDDAPEEQYAATWAICPTCDGDGSYVNPAIDDMGISDADFAADPDFEREYHGGVYDLRCHTCTGSGKVLDPVTVDGQRAMAEHLEALESFIAMEEAERRAGC